MLCFRLGFPWRYAFPKAHQKARLRRFSVGHNGSRLADLLRACRDARVHFCSREFLLIRVSGHRKPARPLPPESMGGDWWIISVGVTAAVDGYPADVHSFLLADTCGILDGPALGMEQSPSAQSWDLDDCTGTCQRRIIGCRQPIAFHRTRSVRSP